MQNYKEFEMNLQESDRAPEPPSSHSVEALLRLRSDLREADAFLAPSAFEQSTAWTRLEARMKETSAASSAFSFSRIFSYIATAGAVAAIMLLFMRGANEADEGLRIEVASPGMHATPFHSESARADVIWAEGYRYIPSRYTY